MNEDLKIGVPTLSQQKSWFTIRMGLFIIFVYVPNMHAINVVLNQS